MSCHSHLTASRQQAIGSVAKLFDKAENVVPAPAIEGNNVIAQFVENFIYLKGSENGFDQNRRLNSPNR